MQNWMNFWSLIFWVIFTFFSISSFNFTKLLFISEITWLVIYNFVLIIGSINDDITVLSISFLLLGLAGLEFCVGLLLVIIFKKLLKIDNFFEDNTVQINSLFLQNNK